MSRGGDWIGLNGRGGAGGGAAALPHFMAATPKPHHLRDNRPLSGEQLARAKAAMELAGGLIQARPALIAALGLDPAFVMPDANWALSEAEPDQRPALLLDGGEAALNHLRLYAQHFSGFSLQYMRDGEGHPHHYPIDDAYLDWLDQRLETFDEWLTHWLLLMRHTPMDCVYRPPAICGEIGWMVGGVVMNFDTFTYQERISVLHEIGVIGNLRRRIDEGERPLVLEIGAGYGALALALQQIVPGIRYIAIDLPESLVFSAAYLAAANVPVEVVTDPAGIEASPESDVTLIPNIFFERLADAGPKVDLAINTLSLAEMSEIQIETYGRALSDMLGDSGLFFEQNKDNTGYKGLGCCRPILRRFFKSGVEATPDSFQYMRNGPPMLWANFEL